MCRDHKILLLDMDAFFASVEQACNPELCGKPVVVGGAAGTRSVVSAASYEARKYGIRSAMPVDEALRRCRSLIVVRGDMRKYIDVSRRIFKICSNFSDLLEIYSIDECFLDVTPTEHLFNGARRIAVEIKKKIQEELALTCSIGIGPNKLIAKLASGMEKPDGLTEICRDDVADVLESLPVGKLHGIGEKAEAKLLQMSIPTAGVLGRTPHERLVKHFGAFGEELQKMGLGISDDPVVPYYNSREVKSVGHSHTLEKNTTDWTKLQRILLRLSEMVGRRLREQHLVGRTITLTVRHSNMHTFTRRKTLQNNTDDGYVIYQTALAILREQVGNISPIRLLGVTASNLTNGTGQMDLFADENSKKLTETTDNINDKFGEYAICRASLIETARDRNSSAGFTGRQR